MGILNLRRRGGDSYKHGTPRRKRQRDPFSLKLRFEPLEDRRLLATFVETGSTLMLALEANEQLSILSRDDAYTFSLGETGAWTGADSARVSSRHGTPDLSVNTAQPDAFSRISIVDSGLCASIHIADDVTDFGNVSLDLMAQEIVIDGRLTAREVRLAGSGTLTVSGTIQSPTLSLTAGLLDIYGEVSSSGPTGGQLTIAADRLINSGRITADGSVGVGGDISIALAERMMQTQSGAISASGTGGSGGHIEIFAGVGTAKAVADPTAVAGVYLSGTIAADGIGADTVGGQITITGGQLDLYGAQLQADGNLGGGKILVGGDFHGGGLSQFSFDENGTVPLGSVRAQQVTVNHSSTLSADALVRGNGGQVIVWSDGQTNCAGLLSAQGGSQQGDGGQIEVSGKAALDWQGQTALSAPAGQPGSLWLDPKNIIVAGSAFAEFVDPHPAAGNKFGYSVVPLSTGNVVITSPYDDVGATDAGAVYLFNGATGALISTLRGSHSNDNLGYISSGSALITLSNGNYLIVCPSWDNGATSNAGAVTWGRGTAGVSGVVSSANSLVGSKANDYVGYISASSTVGVMALSNGNYLVNSPTWDNGAVTDAGAVTWGSGTTGRSGVVSNTNSLVGSHANDQLGYASSCNAITVLSNDNYVVSCPTWDNGTVTNAGAATWGSGTIGISGVISSLNSLVGSTAGDQVGYDGVTALTNGNYVVNSHYWNNGSASSAGAVTWGSGTAGISGLISSANSLIGSSTGDYIGLSGVIALTNGNYVVGSWYWHNGAVEAAGAATWGNGTAGVTGFVSSSNSLIGFHSHDQIGYSLTALTNGNYVVSSSAWYNGAVSMAGAVTWGSGTTGINGVVSSANSLVGSTANDRIGASGVIPLTNGNYLVCSSSWDNGAAADAGAVTWGSGTTGIQGVISSANSLVGSTTEDRVGYVSFGKAITELTNGNYVVSCYTWDNGAATDAGAVTWGNGTTGVSGVISNSNSLVGSTASDQVGYTDRVGYSGVTALNNGNYVVSSPYWDNGAATNAGEVTWANGTTGISGVVSIANSLVGSTNNDRVGLVTSLSNGNYVVSSFSWNNGIATSAGAVTWGNGTAGISGMVSSANSLVGSTTLDQVGYGGVTALSNGNYVVNSYNWKNGTATNAGAVTWGNGTAGISGVVSDSNSLVGSQADDQVGRSGVTALANGNYVVSSSYWNNGSLDYAGAVTRGSGTTGVSGVVSSGNSLVGSHAYDYVGGGGVTVLSNGNYIVRSTQWNFSRGAVTWGSGTRDIIGAISSTNSLVGLTSSAGIQPVAVDNVNGTFYAPFLTETGTPPGGGSYGGRVRVGSQSAPALGSQTFASQTGQSIILTPAVNGTLNTGAAVTLQASNDITISNAITANNPSGNGGNLTLQAGRSVLINANIVTDNGNLTLTANDTVANGVVDADRESGNAVITMAEGTTLDVGVGTLTVNLRNSTDKTFNERGAATLENVNAGSLVVGDGDIMVGGTMTCPVSVTVSGGSLTTASITTGTLTIGGGDKSRVESRESRVGRGSGDGRVESREWRVESGESIVESGKGGGTAVAESIPGNAAAVGRRLDDVDDMIFDNPCSVDVEETERYAPALNAVQVQPNQIFPMIDSEEKEQTDKRQKQPVNFLQMAAYNAVWTYDKRRDPNEIRNRPHENNVTGALAQERVWLEEARETRIHHRALEAIFSGLGGSEF